MYKLHKNFNGVVCVVELIGKESYIPMDESNTDYQEYLKWLAEGNTPEPADQGE